MLLSLCTILFITESTAAASLRFGEVQIKGTGRVSADHASMDIHLEIIHNNVSQTLPSQLIQSAQALSFKVKDKSAGNTPATFIRKPVFGKETAQEFIKSALDSHNKFRAIHNAPPLKLNLKMTKEAEEFAKRLAQNGAKHLPMAHEDQLILQKENEGENLAAGGSRTGGLTAHGAVKNWYNEVCSYDWGKGGYEPQAAHFMQVIWKSTTELGIGKAEGLKNGRPHTYIVARYKPAITKEALKNVAKGMFTPSYCRNVLKYLQSDLTQNKTHSRSQQNPAERFSKQSRFGPNKLPNFRQLPAGNTRLQPQPDPIQNKTHSRSQQNPTERFSKQSPFGPNKLPNFPQLPGNTRLQTQSDPIQNKTNSQLYQNPAEHSLKQSSYFSNKLPNFRQLPGNTRLQTQSVPIRNTTHSRWQQNLAEHSLNQSSQYSNNLANLQPLRGNTRLPSSSFNLNEPGSYGSISKPNYGYLNIANSYPYQHSQQNDKLSFYAGNAWSAASRDRSRLPMTSSEYHPKQAEVVEEFVDGDDTGNVEYGESDNRSRENERFTQSLIPVMKSEEAAIEDDDDDDSMEDDLRRKAHVPKPSN